MSESGRPTRPEGHRPSRPDRQGAGVVLGRHEATLLRRIAYLEARPPTPQGRSYDRRELAALHVARELLARARAEQQGTGYPTSFLLEEAREHLLGGEVTLERAELVAHLEDRARLLEQIELADNSPPEEKEGP